MPARPAVRRRGEQPITVALGPHRDPRLAMGVARYARRAGWILNVLPWRIGRIDAYLLGDARGILGVFSRGHDVNLDAALASGLPLVSMGAPPEDVGIPSVGPDYPAIGRMGAEHLIERGYKRLLLGTDSAVGVGAVFQAAVKTVVARAGATMEYMTLPLEWDWLPEYANANRPTGILAVSDMMGALVLQQCRRMGLSVPDELAVVGAGNEEVLCLAEPARLTSVDPDHERVGYEAARLMDALLHGRKGPRRPLRVPPRGVVVRDSSDHLVVGHPDAARAVAYVREHFREPITPNSVAEAAGISRVYLDVLLRRSFGRTVMQEILRRRVALAAEMLVQTNAKCDTIAASCGMSNALTLHRTFKRLFGCTPREYAVASRARG